MRSSLLLFAAAVQLGQVQGANAYAGWATMPTDPLSAEVVITEAAPATFWSFSWEWGYVGIQTDGTGADGQTQDQAIFSISGGRAAGRNCVDVAEGDSASCRLAVPVETGRSYAFTVSDASETWTATVDGAVIGSIQSAEASTGFVSSFIEYFGGGAGCAAVPASSGDFTLDVPTEPGRAVAIGAVSGRCPDSVHAYPWGAAIALNGGG